MEPGASLRTCCVQTRSPGRGGGGGITRSSTCGRGFTQLYTRCVPRGRRVRDELRWARGRGHSKDAASALLWGRSALGGRR